LTCRKCNIDAHSTETCECTCYHGGSDGDCPYHDKDEVMDDATRKKLDDLARSRMLYWKHKKTPMIAKALINTRSSLTGDESLMVRFDKVPTVDEIIPRSRMEQSFYLVTEEAYKEAFDKLPKVDAPRWTVDLEAGTAVAART
jgi:hypothetical protein